MPAKPTLEEACRAMGLSQPAPIGEPLAIDGLKDLFRQHPAGVHFWITDAFHQVTRLIPPQECFRFWQQEVSARLMVDGVFMREMWPERYAYLAQQWTSPYPEPLIELMRCD